MPFALPETLPLSIQTAWLIPLYGFSGMLLSLPWASGWIKREGPRPAAYLNLLLSVVALVHGSLVIREVLRTGPRPRGLSPPTSGDCNHAHYPARRGHGV